MIEEDTLNKKRFDKGRLHVLIPLNQVCPSKIKVKVGNGSFCVKISEESSPVNFSWLANFLGLQTVISKSGLNSLPGLVRHKVAASYDCVNQEENGMGKKLISEENGMGRKLNSGQSGIVGKEKTKCLDYQTLLKIVSLDLRKREVLPPKVTNMDNPPIDPSKEKLGLESSYVKKDKPLTSGSGLGSVMRNSGEKGLRKEMSLTSDIIPIFVEWIDNVEDINEPPPTIYMAYLSKTALIFVLVTIFYIASLEGRKVLNMENTKGGRPLVSNLVASHVLQNGPTPTIPSPIAKSVQMAQNGRISVTLHNAAIYRYLGASVPSPGIGN
ncbi:hypothetical protein EZV62_007982 [Acer yangbiense]|uniref:Uncharacterized protein n=1 Tax=Acer yangbiense TaxID=1000413 RepID=A0A5C7IBV1_9ROSI|nr:hypothetical protein EZV62_007982 [Acer yangbiense]